MLEDGCFRWTMFDEAATFDGAGTQVVREHFKEWRKHVLREEQDLREEIEARVGVVQYHESAVRCRFCLQIDRAALQSIVSSESCSNDDEWVNLVEADWNLEAIVAEREQDRLEDPEASGKPEEFDECVEVCPKIDGCSEKIIGRMRAQYKSLITVEDGQ